MKALGEKRQTKKPIKTQRVIQVKRCPALFIIQHVHRAVCADEWIYCAP